MIDRRQKNTNWTLNVDRDGAFSTDQATLAVLMDLRDELQAVNAVLRCDETRRIPSYLRRIVGNTAKPKRRP